MELRDLIEHVGEERFTAARKWAWGTAASTGQSSTTPTEVRPLYKPQDVPHDLEELIWTSGEHCGWSGSRWRSSFTARCRAMRRSCTRPATTRSGTTALELFWDEYRKLISDADDRLAEPIAYSLWCDYFENPDTVEEAWGQMVQPGALTDRALQRLLEAAGPVPFRLKQALYDELIADERWHPGIFRSLLHSTIDVFGDVDAVAARDLLACLSLSEDTPGLRELRDKLG